LSNLVQDTAGNLYGAFANGGIGRTRRHPGYGTIFELSPPAPGQTKWTEQTIFEFSGEATGCQPYGGVILGPGGVLYGTTSECSSNVFELSPPANGGPWKETVLYTFAGGQDAQGPGAPLLLGNGGVLYGTTSGGGSHRLGTVFELMPPQNGQTQWSEAILYSFAGGNDGSTPTAPVVADDSGAIYGTTFFGGGCVQETTGCGTVFMLAPPAAGQTAWTETVLHAFTDGADGGSPSGGLYRDKSGGLFGNTSAGGQIPCSVNYSGCGTTYLLTPHANKKSRWTFETLYAFTGQADGIYPGGPLVSAQRGGVYGTALDGVTGVGTVFELVPPAHGQGSWSEDNVYNFPSSGKDGGAPQQGLLQVPGGAYVGTAGGGRGIHFDGVVFQLKP
jgi:uncharacterized repeat protein (TIGR03803 family)